MFHTVLSRECLEYLVGVKIVFSVENEALMCLSVSHSPFFTVIRSLSCKPSLLFQYVTDTTFEGIMDEGKLEVFRVVLLVL